MGAGGRVRRPPNPLRPAGCRCRVRVGGQAGPCDRCGFKGMRAAEIRTALPAFFAERAVRISAPLRRVPSRCVLAQGCLAAGEFEAWAVRERRVAPRRILCPRTPLFPTRGSARQWRERRAGRRRRTNRHNLAWKCRSARKGQRRTEPLSTGGRCRQDVGGTAENREVLSKWNRKKLCSMCRSGIILCPPVFLSLRF